MGVSEPNFFFFSNSLPRVADGSVKMCFPKVPRLCQAVGFVTRKITRSEDDASSFLECHSCDTDACNHVAGPPRAAGASLVLGVALVSTLLRRLAVA
ncbi:hypothetical protein PR048_029348 [Dryococelus australis]|uniref:Uncharacterized protein n=1 Tax=Dryococelus australis TaxID=614101 RepID=A0ABQ9GFQ4_9NEOP|nr:hypothetical protein PR048_029348 [Dryococelus australis]